MKVLQLTAHFSPNIGGVETHLDDLCKVLVKKDIEVVVLTYRPLHTKTSWKILEKEKNLEIFRIPWIPNLFYKLIKSPVLEFLYLLPGLFIFTPIILFLKAPNVIQAHGLVAGFVGVFWGKIFNKRIIITTHSIYNFPKKGLYRNFATWIFNNAFFCLGLSKQAADEIKSLGVPSKKVNNFTYWIDLDNFKKIENAKIKLGWDKEFVVLFVGRLIPEKGIAILLQAATKWDKRINLKIIGSGPMANLVQRGISGVRNIESLGVISQNNLPLYYSGVDMLIMPSIAEEGFGRVILESLACGTPVIGANRGAIPEALDSTVGDLIEISVENIVKQVEYFYTHRVQLKNLAKNCRSFAERRFSEKNADTIIAAYQK